MNSLFEEISDKFPRFCLINNPSPLRRLRRLEEYFNYSLPIYMKSDDAISALSSSKLRYLEFILGDYFLSSYDCIVHATTAHSNYLAQIAFVSAQLGIRCVLGVSRTAGSADTINLSLAKRYGAEIIISSNAPSELREEITIDLQSQGQRPYVVRAPFNNVAGIMGLLHGYAEFLRQTENAPIPRCRFYCCSSGNSYLGLSVANYIFDTGNEVIGVAPIRFEDAGLYNVAGSRSEMLKHRLAGFSELAGYNFLANIGKIEIDESFVGPGYGKPSQATKESTRLLAELDGVLLDHTYTAKAMARLISDLKKGEVRLPIVFWHSGGVSNAL